MSKDLTGKMKEEIVSSQLNLIRSRDCNNILNYSLLKEYLMEGIDDYLLKKNASFKEIDLKLMKEIDKNMDSEVSTRLLNAARDYFKIPFPKDPNEGQLLELYNNAEKELSKNGRYFDIRNYGQGTHKLLAAYLRARALIKTDIVSG